MEDDKFKDLLEDEELTALRLAALASKKKTEQNKSRNEHAGAQPIDSIVSMPSASSELLSNQIPFVQSDRSMHNNYLWRKQNQSMRRRSGPFPKNHRSNLIVISPVALNDVKDSEEKAPPLILPQHKWCNSTNEDSMSPKTLRRTGPTRFNRHGSDSESSDDDESDYEPSDNDSGSNETILQDEPPEHFSCLSPDNLSDSVEKKRRLSFQSLDSDVKSDAFDKNEATSVYKSLKNSLYSDTKQDKYSVQQHLNDREQTFNNYDNIYINSNAGHAYVAKSSDLSEDLVFKQNKSSIGKGESGSSDNINSSLNKSTDPSKMWQENHKDYSDKRHSLQMFTDAHSSKSSVWQHSESFRNDNSLYHSENQCISADPRSYSDNSVKPHYLSDSDLRLELKKRMQEMKSKVTCIGNNEMVENEAYTQYDNSWDKNRSGYSQKNSEIHLSSANSIGGTQDSSFHQTNRIKQNFTREDDDDERGSNFNQQRSRRSISRERTTQESSSSRDKSRFDYSFNGRRRYSRSSSLDRNRRSSSQGRRRRERSSSRDEKRCERSSSQSRIKRNNNDGRSESNLSPNRNKFENSHRHGKSDNSNNFAEGRRNWYKSSPKERSERSSSRDRSKRDCSSSSESRHGRSTSRERNKFSSSNSKSNQQYNVGNEKERHTQSHDRNRYDSNLNRGRSRHTSDSSHNRNRRGRSSSRDRSRRESSRIPDSRSGRSCSPKKHRYSSSREGSKGERSSSESESKYRCHSRNAFNASKFTSKQNKSKHDAVVNQNTSIKAKESNQDLVQECDSLKSKILKSNLNFERVEDEGSKKISTKDQSKSIERNRSERSSSKEKNLGNTKPNQINNRMKSSYKKRYSRSRSSSSESCSSSYSSSSSHSSKPKIRSVPSVIKPVLVKNNNESRGNVSERKSIGKSTISFASQTSVHSVCTKRNLDNVEINKPSNIKCGRIDGDSKASEGKRVPVHMRLGAFPRKRVIQMPKDVEAAFVNTSSSSDGENANTKCKRQNIRIVTDMYNAKNRIDLIQQKYSSDNKPAKRSSPDTNEENFKRVKAHR